MTLGPDDLVLCSGTLTGGIDFTERITVARDVGFTAISLWGRDYQAAREQGMNDGDLRLILSDKGVAVAEIDPLWSWLPGTDDIQIPAEHDSDNMFSFDESRLFDLAEAVSARSVNVVDIFGGYWNIDDATESFATLCRRAAERGLLVHLEFLPWSKIPDLETAWQIVRNANEDNGGVAIDAWHYFRSSSDGGVLRSIPGERVLCVQLSDGPALAEANLMDETLHRRLLPGHGEFNLVQLLTDLRYVGSVAPIGVEVFSDRLDALTTHEAARLASISTQHVLEIANEI
jgi:sugar phosphate isomerase/epimerase